MRYIFLDVDGVLNSHSTKTRYDNCYAYLEDSNFAVLKTIMEMFNDKYGEENVQIILSSSWRTRFDIRGRKFESDSLRDSLDRVLERFGLKIEDQTPFINTQGRGIEIATYLALHSDNLDGYLVLDDCDYDDMKKYYCSRHWVQTSYYANRGGLQPYHVKKAIAAMEKPIKEDEWQMLKDLKAKSLEDKQFEDRDL